MSSFIDENTQFVDDAGTPLAGGMAYFGVVNLDPKLNLTTIFSDRGLTIPIANPQTLNAEGRSSIKIWVDGEYSLLIEDVLGVQHLQELDQGQTIAGGNFPLTQVGGTNNNITAKGTPKITLLVDKAFYVLEAISANDGPMTLAIDDLAAVAIRQNVDQEIQSGKVQDKQTLVLTFNLSENVFEWVNQSDKVLYFTKPAAVASSATTDIWSPLGNYFHITGTATISSFGTAPQAGSFKFLEFDNTATLTPGANLIVPGNLPLITAAGDTCQVIADTTTIAKVVDYQRAAIVPLDNRFDWTFVPEFSLIGTSPRTLLSGLPPNISEIVVSIKNWSFVGSGSDVRNPLFKANTASGPPTSGYSGNGVIHTVPAGNNVLSSNNGSDGFNVGSNGLSTNPDHDDQVSFDTIFHRFNDNFWNYMAICTENSFIAWGQGSVDLSEPLTGLLLDINGGNRDLDNGIVNIKFR